METAIDKAYLPENIHKCSQSQLPELSVAMQWLARRREAAIRHDRLSILSEVDRVDRQMYVETIKQCNKEIIQILNLHV